MGLSVSYSGDNSSPKTHKNSSHQAEVGTRGAGCIRPVPPQLDLQMSDAGVIQVGLTFCFRASLHLGQEERFEHSPDTSENRSRPEQGGSIPLAFPPGFLFLQFPEEKSGWRTLQVLDEQAHFGKRKAEAGNPKDLGSMLHPLSKSTLTPCAL